MKRFQKFSVTRMGAIIPAATRVNTAHNIVRFQRIRGMKCDLSPYCWWIKWSILRQRVLVKKLVVKSIALSK